MCFWEGAFSEKGGQCNFDLGMGNFSQEKIVVWICSILLSFSILRAVFGRGGFPKNGTPQICISEIVFLGICVFLLSENCVSENCVSENSVSEILLIA